MGLLDRIKRAFRDPLFDEVVATYRLERKSNPGGRREGYPEEYWEGDCGGTPMWVEKSSDHYFVNFGAATGDDECFYIKRAEPGSAVDPGVGEHWLEEFVGDRGGVGRQFAVDTYREGHDYRELRERAFVDGLPCLSRAFVGVEAYRRGLTLTLLADVPGAKPGLREIESDIRLAQAMFLALPE
jgi:hypothetical protein